MRMPRFLTVGVLLGLAAIAFAACGNAFATAPRTFVAVPLATQAADSARFGTICDTDPASPQTVGCQFVFADSTAAPINILPPITAATGDTVLFAFACPGPLTTVVVGGIARGLNQSGIPSVGALTARGEAVCDDLPAGAPRSFLIFTRATE